MKGRRDSNTLIRSYKRRSSPVNENGNLNTKDTYRTLHSSTKIKRSHISQHGRSKQLLKKEVT